MRAELNQVSKRLDVQDFILLLSVSETGSFRKAAIRLDIGQSAVTRRIQKLEEALGVSLFERSRSGARLTNAGASFVVRTRAIIDDLQLAIQHAHASGVAKNGSLLIGVIASLSRGAVRNVVATFLDRHPNVDLCFAEAGRGELLTALSERTLDVIIAVGEPSQENGDGLILVREDIYLAVPQTGALAIRDRISWDEVADEIFLVSRREPGPEIQDYIIRRVSDLGQKAFVQCHRLGREGIMSLVGLGLGVSLVAEHWRGLRYPNVAFVPIGDLGENVPFSLTWKAENDNPALRRFISLARIEARRNGALS